MRLNELIFQGIFGQESPARLRFDGSVSRVNLPGGVSFEQARAVLFNLLYPTDRTESERAALERSSDPRLAVVFEAGGETFRVVRKKPQNSVRLQVNKEGDYRTAATGAADVSSALDDQLGRPSVRIFRALNNWDFDGAIEATASNQVDLSEIGPQAEQMIEEYEQTLEMEELDRKLEDRREKIDQLHEKYGKGLEVEDKLERARERLENIELASIDEEDLELLRDKNRRLEEYNRELQQLDEKEDAERRKVEQMEPRSPWQDNGLWIGLAVGVAAIAISFVDLSSLRWIALFDSVGFGIVAWTFLKYLTDREKVNIHKVRIESIKRRISEVRREMVEFKEECDHLLVHANAKDEMELINRQQKAHRLEQAVEELEEKSARLADNDKYQEARERLDELESEREDLQERRDDLPAYGTDLFQLENELRALGIDAKAVVRARKAEASDGEKMSEYELLRELTEDLGYWTAGALDDKLQQLWGKMARHILGDEFGGVGLDEDGGMVIDEFTESDDLAGWLETHSHENRMLAGTLALALHIRSSSRERRVNTLFLEEPRECHPAALAEGLVDVFQGAAKRVDVALLSGAS